MTINKAIELLQSHLLSRGSTAEPDLFIAQLLALHALRRLRELRQNGLEPAYILLGRETAD